VSNPLLSMAPRRLAAVQPSASPKPKKPKREAPPPPPPPPPSGPLLDLADALAYLKVGESYLYEVLATGKLKRVQLPSPRSGGNLKRLLFRRADLDDFINSHVG
jgi:predicted DNA-binding transcriptional regulator AlpA